MLLLTTPAGHDIEVPVPEGVQPGDEFEVSFSGSTDELHAQSWSYSIGGGLIAGHKAASAFATAQGCADTFKLTVMSSDELLDGPHRCTVHAKTLVELAAGVQEELGLDSAISITHREQWVTELGDLPRDAMVVIARQTEGERAWLEDALGWENPLHGRTSLG